MAARIIDGKQLSAALRTSVAAGVSAFEAAVGRPPGLSTVRVGDDPASAIYINLKHRACADVGIRSVNHELPASATQREVLKIVESCVAADDIDGVLVQVPMPAHLDPLAIVDAIPPSKDIDGHHPRNIGAVAMGRDGLPSCTPAGVMYMLDAYDIPIEGATATVVGRSATVGTPMAFMLLARNATVSVAHHLTRDLAAVTRTAEILVVATGVPGLIRADMVKLGATVIDIGITRTPDGIVGDVAFDEVAEVAGAISPVPGGVGPMTIAMLLRNTLVAACQRAGIDSPLG